MLQGSRNLRAGGPNVPLLEQRGDTRLHSLFQFLYVGCLLPECLLGGQGTYYYYSESRFLLLIRCQSNDSFPCEMNPSMVYILVLCTDYYTCKLPPGKPKKLGFRGPIVYGF